MRTPFTRSNMPMQSDRHLRSVASDRALSSFDFPTVFSVVDTGLAAEGVPL